MTSGPSCRRRTVRHGLATINSHRSASNVHRGRILSKKKDEPLPKVYAVSWPEQTIPVLQTTSNGVDTEFGRNSVTLLKQEV